MVSCRPYPRPYPSHPSQVCLEFTFALLFTANAFTLRLFYVKRYGSVSLYNLPPHHHHHKFVLSLPSHCISQQTPSRCALFMSRDMAVFLFTTCLHTPPSQVGLEFTFALLFTANDFTLRLFVKRYGSVSL